MSDDPKDSGTVFGDVKRQMQQAFAQLPEVPPDGLTEAQRRARMEELERASRFKAGCPREFCVAINRNILRNPWAFDQIAQWNGTYPGPLGAGATGLSKTRAAWSALGRLYVREGKRITSFTSKRLFERYFEAHMDGTPKQFWAALARFDVFLIDDLDKYESNERNNTVLFELMDWIYANRRPVICTTNRPREWWLEKMGTAFARRMFDEAFFTVPF